MATILYTPRAERDLRRLDRPVAERILEAHDGLAREGAGDVRPLTGVPGELRLRVGDWRVRFTRDREGRTLTVLRVVHRGQAYRD
jgi:mRNA interferase RelE/StbE